MDNNISVNNITTVTKNYNCKNSCTDSKVDYISTPCEKNNIYTENTITSDFLLLSNKIFSCYSHKNNISNFVLFAPFFIQDNPDFKYVDGAPIYIENITSSANSIGPTGPFYFSFNGNLNTFYPKNNSTSICQYDISGVVGQIEADISIASANETINLANSITPDLSITDQINLLSQLVKQSTYTNVLATNAIISIAKSFYPDNTRTNLQRSLIEAAEASHYHAEAQQIVTDILPNPSSAELSSAASSEKFYINNSNVRISEAASIILARQPTASSNILNYAKYAISYAEQSNNAMEEAVSTSPPNFFQLITPLILNVNAISAVINALEILGSYTQGENFATLLHSISLQILAMFNTNLALEAGYFAYLQASSPDIAQTYIDLCKNYIILSSDLIINSFDFIDTLQNISLYNEFESETLKQTCSTSSNKNSLFVQLSPKLSACNLSVTLTGKIGDFPFTASYSNPAVFPLSLAGYRPQDFGFYVCTPSNENFRLHESMNYTFSINCVIPTFNYNASLPNTILASVFSTLCENIEISVLTKAPIVTISNNSLICENSKYD